MNSVVDMVALVFTRIFIDHRHGKLCCSQKGYPKDFHLVVVVYAVAFPADA